MSEAALSNLATELHAHAKHCEESIRTAENRAEYIKLIQISLEATRLANLVDSMLTV